MLDFVCQVLRSIIATLVRSFGIVAQSRRRLFVLELALHLSVKMWGFFAVLVLLGHLCGILLNEVVYLEIQCQRCPCISKSNIIINLTIEVLSNKVEKARLGKLSPSC